MTAPRTPSAVDALAEKFLTSYAALDPMVATYIGVPGDNGALPDLQRPERRPAAAVGRRQIRLADLGREAVLGERGLDARHEIAAIGGIVGMLEPGKGQNLNVQGVPLVVKDFLALVPGPYSPGQGNGAISIGAAVRVPVRLETTNGAQVVMSLAKGAPPFILASTTYEAGYVPGHSLATWSRLGVPSQDAAGRVIFVGEFAEAAGKRTGVFAQDSAGDLQLLQDGSQPVAGNTIADFDDAIAANGNGAAFLATLAGDPATRALFWDDETANGPRLIARTGDTLPGSATSPLNAFTSIALPGSPGAPFFTGKLRGRNSAGAWCVDSTGELRLIARQGGTLEVGGVSKRIKTVSMLPYIATSPAQTRSYTANGQALFLVTFTDRSQAIVRANLP